MGILDFLFGPPDVFNPEKNTGTLPNIISDPKLRTRQDQLDAQWSSLWAVYQGCDNTPDSSFSNFATDLRNWRVFYNGGSDWSSSSENATNEWQSKAQEWSNKLNTWGCTGNQSADDLPNGLPTVKDPPPDVKSILENAKDAISHETDSFFSTLATMGWVAVGLAVLVVLAIVYLLTHAKVSTPQASIG